MVEDINNSAVTNGEFSVSGIDGYKQLIMRLALCSRGVINPMCSLLGGVVAQEVLKAASGMILIFIFYQVLNEIN
jgi:hypothetical protein